MGLRKYQRQIAKNRLDALGVGRVNRQMHREQDGQKNWVRALTGETGEAARKAQIKKGWQMKAERDNARARVKAGIA